VVEIREFRESDWEGICRVHDLARPIELRGSCDPRAFIPLAFDPEREELRRCRVFVACDREDVVGFVGQNGDYLAWLYVDPAYHGRGIGRELLRRVIPLLGPTAWTITLAGNLPALRLYESEGFAIQRTFEGDNAGYPCTSHRLERREIRDGASLQGEGDSGEV
jgi:GNAT superfamily N-acetyltransferase